MDSIEKIIDICDKYEDETINLRRMIHGNPELSHKEYETSNMVEEYLINIGIEVKRIGETGVLGIINGKEKGKTILLRADMDALPIDEETDLSFKSKNKGVMHACGHDVHTANLLIVSKILSELKDKWNGTVKLIFQPAEERGGGAKEMIDLGVLDDPKVDLAMALHIMPIESGKILINSENITAYSDGFKLKILGKKAHTRKPEEGIDAINIAAHIIVSLNSIISKNISPLDRATFSIGKISGGVASNIVADSVELKGMMRSLDSDARDIMKEKIEKMSKGIAESFGGHCEFIFNEGYPSVYNDRETTEKIANIFEENLLEIYTGFDMVDQKEYILKDANPIMAAEDFGFFSQKIPSLYYMVGTGDIGPGHSSRFFVDEKWIRLCTRTMVMATMSYLQDSME